MDRFNIYFARGILPVMGTIVAWDAYKSVRHEIKKPAAEGFQRQLAWSHMAQQVSLVVMTGSWFASSFPRMYEKRWLYTIVTTSMITTTTAWAATTWLMFNMKMQVSVDRFTRDGFATTVKTSQWEKGPIRYTHTRTKKVAVVVDNDK